jgi:hypothetical protein
VKFLDVLITILIPILEIAFASAHADLVSGLRLTYILCIIYIINQHKKTALFLILVAVSLTEFFTFQSVIGIGSISILLAIILITYFYRFASFLNPEDNFLQMSLVFALALVIRHFLFLLFGYQSNQLMLSVLAMNYFVFVVAYLINSRLYTKSENAFAK